MFALALCSPSWADKAAPLWDLLDSDRAAQAEFDAVLAEEPPEPVVQHIRLAQAAIAKEKESQRPRLTGYVDGGVAYDSNINAGVKSAVVNLPVFGEIE